MGDNRSKWLVETDWLAAHLSAPDIVVLDASWHLPTSKRDARAEYEAEHIPGALFFDIDEIADTESDLPHMLPSPVKFAARMRKMGIGDGMRIVVYDSDGLFSAARVWWMFRVMGARDVAVLNGGLKKWKAEGRPLEDGAAPARSERHFTARRNARLVRDLADMKALLADGGAGRIVDARSPERFAGASPEPRPGLRAGHIPGSRNLHYALLLNEDGTVRSNAEIADLLKRLGLKGDEPIVTTCGSGVTAAILALALALLGNEEVAVYDGSWSEWGAEASLPVETGPAETAEAAPAGQ